MDFNTPFSLVIGRKKKDINVVPSEDRTHTSQLLGHVIALANPLCIFQP